MYSTYLSVLLLAEENGIAIHENQFNFHSDGQNDHGHYESYQHFFVTFHLTRDVLLLVLAEDLADGDEKLFHMVLV